MIANLLKGFLKRLLPIPIARQQNPSKPESIIQPPSVLLKQISVYTSLLRSIENYGTAFFFRPRISTNSRTVDIDITKITTTVMLEELYAP